MHRRKPHYGNSGSARPLRAEQTPRFLRPIGLDIGLQQGELDQIVLRTAAANALVFPSERRERLDRAGKISALEGREAARQRRKVGTGWVTPLSRQRLHLASTSIERGIISRDSLCQDHMQIGEPVAWVRQRAVRIVIQFAPGSGVARMASEFGTPQI